MTEPHARALDPDRACCAVARKEMRSSSGAIRAACCSRSLLPRLLLVLFGYAITWDVRRHRASRSWTRTARRASRALVDALRGRRATSSSSARLESAADDRARSSTRGAAQHRAGHPARLRAPTWAAGRPRRCRSLVDGSDANTATIALGYARADGRSVGAARELATAGASTPPIAAESRVWYNEELASRNMIVPGLVAVIMMIIAAMLTSLTIAREWERGTMEQLAATPVTRLEVVLGKLLPYLAIGLRRRRRDLGARASCVFDVPFRGNVLLLGVLSFLFLVGALGLGIFISAVAQDRSCSRPRSRCSSTFLPAFLLSGFMFALDVMPRAAAGASPARPGALLPGRDARHLPQGRRPGRAAGRRRC